MALTSEIKNQLARYYRGEIDLTTFQEWLDHALDAQRDPEANRFAQAIEWLFCDFERGLLSRDQMMEALLQLASPVESSGSPQRKATVRMILVVDHTQTSATKGNSGSGRTSSFSPGAGSLVPPSHILQTV